MVSIQHCETNLARNVLPYFIMQVSLFLLVGIIIAGAALGYWIVRKFVVSEDGSVDAGIAQFMKWTMRVLAATLILQVCHVI